MTLRLTLLLAFLVTLASTACSSTDSSASKGNQTVAGQPAGSLTDPNGGFGDETAAQRRADWLRAPAPTPPPPETLPPPHS